MTRKYLAFDIETAKAWPEGQAADWKSCRPLGIACAATLLADTDEVVLWQGRERMSQNKAKELVDYLTAQVERGYTILTWNGAGFDFDVLAEESGMAADCKQLVPDHVDMMFHVLCRLGYGVSLDAAAKGMGLAGKTMNGAEAPILWQEGKREEVLEYVAQDARTTVEVATACEARQKLCWTSHRGNRRTMKLPDGWLTVEQAEGLPLPNTWWMSDPWPRDKFTGWLG